MTFILQCCYFYFWSEYFLHHWVCCTYCLTFTEEEVLNLGFFSGTCTTKETSDAPCSSSAVIRVSRSPEITN